jgi:DNA-binding MarR family transcriptional regulator
MDSATEQIEQQMTMLLRRVQRIHISTSSGEMDLDRSAYGILCRLADEGPQRLGLLATAFGLDPSTITRQVQALEKADLVRRRPDADDRRASILDLTEEGRTVLEHTRAYRRRRLEELLDDWAETDRNELARLLTKVNDSIAALVERDQKEPVQQAQ